MKCNGRDMKQIRLRPAEQLRFGLVTLTLLSTSDQQATIGVESPEPLPTVATGTPPATLPDAVYDHMYLCAPLLVEALRELHEYAQPLQAGTHHARSLAAFERAGELLDSLAIDQLGRNTWRNDAPMES